MNENKRDPIFHGEKGIALVLVLLVVSALSMLVLNLNYTTRVNTHLAKNFRDETRAYFLARGALEAAIYLLQDDEELDYDTRCDPDDMACDDTWSMIIPAREVGDGFVNLNITDEDAKIWINDPDLFKSKAVLMDQLKNYLPLNQEVLDSIQYWVNTDENLSPEGDEGEYYSSLDPPYAPRNGPLLDISELLMIKGIDDNLFYGKSEEYPVGLNEIFTTFSGGKINVNTAPYDVLSALIGGVNEPQDIIDYRTNTPFTNTGEFREFYGDLAGEVPSTTMWGVTSSFFFADITVQVNNVIKKVGAVLKRDKNSANVNISVIYWREE